MGYLAGKLKYSKNALTTALLLVLALCLPLMVENPYYLHSLIAVYMNAMLGLGFALIYSVGQVTLGASAFWGIGAYASALLVMKGGLSFWLALPLSGVITAAVSLCFGLVAIRYAGVGFITFTLLFCFIVERMFGYIPVFGGWGGLIGIPPPDPVPIPFYGAIEFSGKTPYYYLSLILLLLTMAALSSLYSSRIGRAWRAIRLDSRLAEGVGVYVFGYRLAAFVIASGFAGLAGSFYAHYSMAISPEAFGLLKSVHIQVYAILGGLGHYILGSLTGSFVFTLLPELLQISPSIEPYITGSVLIIIVIFLPSGLTGLIQTTSRFLVRVCSTMVRR
jgi:branched-chain amino acid transport system permease protein